MNSSNCYHERNRRHDQEIRLTRARPFLENQFFIEGIGRLISFCGTFHEQTARHFALHVIVAGRGVMTSRNREYPVKAGDVFLFSPGEKYRYHDIAEAPWSYYWLLPAGGYIVESMAKFGLTAASPFGEGLGRPLPALLAEWFDELREQKESCFFGHRIAWQLLELLDSIRPVSNTLPLGQRIREYIDLAGGGHFTVGELADYFKVDRSTLFVAFKREFGSGVKQYLAEAQLRQAARQLRHNIDTVAAVAERCGFSSSQYFCRVFRKHYGLTPEEFRRGEPDSPPPVSGLFREMLPTGD